MIPSGTPFQAFPCDFQKSLVKEATNLINMLTTEKNCKALQGHNRKLIYSTKYFSQKGNF